MVGRIVFYIDVNKASPYAERVELALVEAGARYETFKIPLRPAPAFYTEKVNPAGKVPAITYGGPEVPPDQPSPESVKIAESIVILEFLADIFPESGLLPADPVERAKVRFFVDAASVKFDKPFFGFLLKGSSGDELIGALEGIQTLLKPGAEVAVGDKFTIADATLAPMLWRMEMALQRHIGSFTAEEGKKVWDSYQGERLRTLREYFDKIKSRKAFKETAKDQDSLAAYYGAVFPKPPQK